MGTVKSQTYAVSAIVSTCNAGAFLGQRLENLVSQTLFAENDLEIIVVDSASDQNEWDLVRQFMAGNRHVVYLRTAERESVYAAWNRGIRLSKARYIINANTDDRFAPRALEQMCRVLDSEPQLHAVYGDWLQTDTPNDTFESDTPKVRFEYPQFFAPLLFHGQITTHAAMIRRKVFDRIGYFDERFEVYGDREFMLRFAEQGFKARKMEALVGLYFNNPDGLEHTRVESGNDEFERVMTEFLNPERFVKLFGLTQVPDHRGLAELYTEAGWRSNGFLLLDGRPASNLGTAGRLFAEALTQDAHYPEALNNLGIISCCHGQNEKGIQLFEKALSGAVAPDEKEVRKNLENAEQGASRPDEFIWLKAGANDQKPAAAGQALSPETEYQRIQTIEDRQKMMSALQDFIKTHPEFAPARNDLGVLYVHAGDQGEALLHLKEAVRLEPANRAYMKNLADFYCGERGQVDQALQLYVKILENDPENVEVLTICGHICLAQRHLQDAETYYGRVLKIEPWNSEIRENLAKLQQSGQQEPPARTAEQLRRQFREQSGNGDEDGAMQTLALIIEHHPEDALARNDLGVLCYKKGLKQKALDHYEQACNLQPENITFKKNLADFYYVEQGRVEDALQLYVRVLELQPRDVESLTMCGHICVSLGRFDDAEVFYRRIMEIEPWNSEVRENLEKLRQTAPTANEPEEIEHIYGQVRDLVNEQDENGAMQLLEALLGRNPEVALAHNDLGVLSYNQGLKAKALDHYEKACRLQPDNLTFKKNLADFYYVEQGRVEDALTVYVQVLEQNPADVETLLITGRICEEIGRPDDAGDFFRRVLEIEPWNEKARERLEEKNVTRKAI